MTESRYYTNDGPEAPVVLDSFQGLRPGSRVQYVGNLPLIEHGSAGIPFTGQLVVDEIVQFTRDLDPGETPATLVILNDGEWEMAAESLRPIDRVLPLSTAMLLGDLLRGCARCSRVVWMDDSDEVRYGTLRHVVGDPEKGYFIRSDADVRDAYVRITTQAGFEWFPLVADVLDKMEAGEFFLRERSGFFLG